MVMRFFQKAIPRKLRFKIKKTMGINNFIKIKALFSINRFEEASIIFQLLRRTVTFGTMIDVGANHGSSLASFAVHGWKVIAFEPDDRNRKILTDLFCGFPSVLIDKRAVSDKNQTNVQFYNSDVSTGISGLSSFHPSHNKSQLVATITLRSFIESSKITCIDFLKIDTEGFDLMVLMGVPWERLKPTVILCEFENRKTIPLGYDFNDLVSYLKDQGYHLLVSEWYPVVEYGANHKWRCFGNCPYELKDKNATGNIIAIKDNSMFNDLRSIARDYEKRFS